MTTEVMFTQVLTTMAHGEGSFARFNPIDTEWRLPGSVDYNAAGVQDYVSLAQGVEATVLTFKGWPLVLAAMADANATVASVIAAVDLSDGDQIPGYYAQFVAPILASWPQQGNILIAGSATDTRIDFANLVYAGLAPDPAPPPPTAKDDGMARLVVTTDSTPPDQAWITDGLFARGPLSAVEEGEAFDFFNAAGIAEVRGAYFHFVWSLLSEQWCEATTTPAAPAVEDKPAAVAPAPVPDVAGADVVPHVTSSHEDSLSRLDPTVTETPSIDEATPGPLADSSETSPATSTGMPDAPLGEEKQP